MTETIIKNDEEKCWVTVSMNVNLGNYESLKVESGYSRILKPGEDPIEILQAMQDDISEIVIDKAKQLKKELKKKHRL